MARGRPLATAAAEEASAVNIVTVVLVVLILMGGLRGYSRGLVAMALGIVAFVISVLVAHAMSPTVATMLDHQFHLGHNIQSAIGATAPATSLIGLNRATTAETTAAIVGAIAFLGILVITEIVLGGLLAWIGRIPNHIPLVGTANRTAGGLLGLLEAGAVAAFAMLLIVPIARAGTLGPVDAMVLHSNFALWLVQLAHAAEPVLRHLP